MLRRLTLPNFEKVMIVLLLSFPLLDYILRHWFKFGGGIWDKAVLIMLLGIALLRKFDTGRKPTGMKPQFIAFIMIGLVLLVYNLPHFSVSFEGFRSIYQFMISFIIGYYVFQNRQDWIKALRFLMLIGGLIALYGLSQPFLGVQMPDSWVDAGEALRFRAFSIVQSPNVLGGYMGLLIPIGIGLFLSERKKAWKIVWLITTLVLFICLLATLSRGAWIAFAFAIFIAAILIDKRVLIGVIVAGILVISFVPTISDRVLYIFSDTYMEKSATDGRIARWNGAFEQATTEPFFGKGMGHYGGAVAQRNFGTTYVDNYYAKTLAEIGFVGLTVFVWLIISLLFSLYQKIITSHDIRLRWLMLGIFAGLCAVVIHNAVENIFEVPFMTVYFWFLAGSLFAAPLLPDEEVIKE